MADRIARALAKPKNYPFDEYGNPQGGPSYDPRFDPRMNPWPLTPGWATTPNGRLPKPMMNPGFLTGPTMQPGWGAATIRGAPAVPYSPHEPYGLHNIRPPRTSLVPGGPTVRV